MAVIKYPEIAAKLRKCRTNCKLSQQQVADALGIDRTAYTWYEIGRSQPSPEKLVVLAKIFRIDPAALLPTESAPALHDDNALTPNPIYSLSRDEQNLLIAFRLLKDEDKSEVLAKITNMAKSET